MPAPAKTRTVKRPQAAAAPAKPDEPKKLTRPVEGGFAIAPCGCYGLVIAIYRTSGATALRVAVPCGTCANTVGVTERWPTETVDGR